MKRILITGGFGFLGRHLVEELSMHCPDLELTAADLQAGPANPRAGVRYLGGLDILDAAALTDAVQGHDAVVHLAGLISFWSGDRDRLFRVNQVGTRNVAAACIAARVDRLVHISSVAAIGYNDREDEPATEELAFDWSSAGEKHYMLSKRAAELELAAASAAGIGVVTANPGLMYGPGDRTNTSLFGAVQSGRVWMISPGGTNVVDVRDVAAGLRLLLFSDARDERFILGGHNLRFTEIVRAIGEAVRTEAFPPRLRRWLHRPMLATASAIEGMWPRRPPLTKDNVDSSFRFRYFSSRKAARRLGWRPRIPFARTVRDMAQDLSRAGIIQPIGGQ